MSDFMDTGGLGGVDLMTQGAVGVRPGMGRTMTHGYRLRPRPRFAHTSTASAPCMTTLTQRPSGLPASPSERDNPSGNLGPSGRVVTCHICAARFINRETLARHLRAVTVSRPCESETDHDDTTEVICPCGEIHRRWGA